MMASKYTEKIARRLGHLKNEQLPAAEELVKLSSSKLASLQAENAKQWQIEEEQLHLARYERDLASLKTEIAEHESSVAR